MFRNLVISKSPNEIKIEDKTEFHLSNVTFINPVFINVLNKDSKIINPTVMIKDSKFPSNVDVVECLKAESDPKPSNKFRIENDHVADDGCIQTSTGRVTMTGNTLGFVSTGDLEFRGGASLL